MTKFRWHKGELEKLDKGIKNFNKKINELKKKGFTELQLPEKMNYYKTRDYIIKQAENPREFLKEQFKIINTLMNKKNESVVNSERGLSVIKATYKIDEIKINAINREREKLKEFYSQFKPTSRGVPIHEKNSTVEDKFRDKKYNFEYKSKRDYEKFRNTFDEYTLTKGERDEKYRENFYLAMAHNLTYDEFAVLKPVIDAIPTEELVKQYYIDKDNSIEFFYDPSDRDLRIESTIEAWNKIAIEGGFIIEGED